MWDEITFPFPNFNGATGSAAAEVPVKIQSDLKTLNLNPAASRLREILR